MRGTLKILSTAIVVLAAAGAVAFKYWDYITNPWTRDGQVRANVIQVAPRVSGPIVKLPIKDNQFVKAGDLLFEIDPRTYKAALDQASANLDETRDDLKDLEQQVKAAQAALDQTASQIKQAESAVKSAEAELIKAKADFERADQAGREGRHLQAQVRQRQGVLRRRPGRSRQGPVAADPGQVPPSSRPRPSSPAPRRIWGRRARRTPSCAAPRPQLETAQLNLEFTQVKASVDGYVTNLNLRLGSQAVANQPALALVDVNSYWVHGFFRETLVGRIKPGDRAVITLMSYPDTPLTGVGGQHRLGHRPAGRQHRRGSAAQHQPDLRVDPPGPAGAGARASGEGARRGRAAGRHHRLRAGHDRD